MGIILSTIRGALNLVLPFTNPHTPFLQDLLHTVILCATLYYAPQIADKYNAHCSLASTIPNDHAQPPNGHAVDETPILRPDTDDDNEALNPEPPPYAPIPPTFQVPQLPRPHIDDEEEQWQNRHDFGEAPVGQPGPANRDGPRPTPQNRAIGTKKAKSLARRDQLRAYHEFHRSQAEERRQADEAGREEREAVLLSEKTRRAEEERRIAEKQRLEREAKKAEERREAEEERERRERVVGKVREGVERKGAVDLVGVAWEEGKDKVWVERLVRASGMSSQIEKDFDGSKVMLTGEGWIVRVDAELMKKAYADAVAYGDGKDGKVSFADFGTILEKAVMARAKAAA